MVLVRNQVRRYGQGATPVVLAHGFGCSQSMWQYIIPLIEHLDIEIITFDYVGAGDSRKDAYNYEKYNSLDGYKQDLLEILHALNIEKCIFIGHSVSGMIGMLAAIERPELFSQLIMIGASPCYVNNDDYNGGFTNEDIYELLDMMEMNFSGWAQYMAPFAMQADKNKAEVAVLEDSFIANDPTIARQFAEVTFMADYRAYLKELCVHTHIIQCAEDSIVPLQVANYLTTNIKSSKLYILEAKGHYPHISHPIQLAELLAQICRR